MSCRVGAGKLRIIVSVAGPIAIITDDDAWELQLLQPRTISSTPATGDETTLNMPMYVSPSIEPFQLTANSS